MKEIIYKFLKDIGHEDRTDMLVAMLRSHFRPYQYKRYIDKEVEYSDMEKEELIEIIENRDYTIKEQAKILHQWNNKIKQLKNELDK